jgi:hypothetical protein
VMESFEVARKDAYGELPEPSTQGVYALDGRYVDAAAKDVRMQFARAGDYGVDPPSRGVSGFLLHKMPLTTGARGYRP